MIVETPAPLVAAIEAEMTSVRASLRRQIQAMEELHGLFTSGRSGIRRIAYLDIPRLRTAYLRYHLPLNTARASCALVDVLRIHPAARDLTEVVDLGAGPGSASLATLFQMAARTLHLHDRSRAALGVARRILQECASAGSGPPGRVATRVGSFPPFPPMPRRALVWLSMVLNELEVGSRRGPDPSVILSRLERALDPHSVVIVMEPALRGPGRSLLRLHDAALSMGGWRVLSPCTHQLRCPLLGERDRSWCHFRFRWIAPALVRQVAGPLGLDHEFPSLAFLAIERVRRGASAPREDRFRARVIGDRMPVEGGTEGIYICQEGRRKVIEAPPPEIRRGDIVAAKPGARARVEVAWKEA